MPELKQTFSPGEVIAGNYRILSIAGSGGMGVVYRALDLRLERTVALKFLPPELNTGVRDKERFLREARTASSLDHPNIGVIHGIEETPSPSTNPSGLLRRWQAGLRKPIHAALFIATSSLPM